MSSWRVPRLDRSTESRASAGQRLLFLLGRLGSINLNMCWAFRLKGSLEVEKLRTAISSTVARHESLRSTAHRLGSSLVFRVEAPRRIEITLVDTSQRRSAEIYEMVWQDQSRPFALDTDWPLRATVFQISETDHILSLVLHHVAADYISKAIILRDIAAAYNLPQRLDEGATTFTPQYSAFVEWEEKFLNSDRGSRAQAYWQRVLKGASPTIVPRCLPIEDDRPPVMSAFTLPIDRVSNLVRSARYSHSTLFAVLVAGIARAVSNCSGGYDVTVSTLLANRRPEFRETVGLFVNFAYLRLTVAGIEQTIDSASRAVMGALKNQAFPTHLLQPGLLTSSHAEALSRGIVCQMLATPVEFNLAGLETDPFPNRAYRTPFGMEAFLTSSQSEIRVELAASTESDPAFVQSMAESFERELALIERRVR